MSRLVRSVLLALVLVVLSAAPGSVAVADSMPVEVRSGVVDSSTQLSSGLPVVHSSGGASVSDRGVACGRPVVRVHPVLFAVLPPPIVDQPPTRAVSIDVVHETVAGTAGGCATGRAPPRATPTSR